MRRNILIFIAGFFGAILLAATEAQPLIHFPIHGFSIAPLEATGGSGNVMLLAMSLPPSDGFAPNVNVLSQNSPGTIDDYIATTKASMEKLELKTIKFDKADDKTAVFEYSGNMGGKALHWYAKASRKDNEVLLVTGTATEDQWAKVSTQLQQCVDSFQRDGDK